MFVSLAHDPLALALLSEDPAETGVEGRTLAEKEKKRRLFNIRLGFACVGGCEVDGDPKLEV